MSNERDYCQRLRELEEAIARQRKFIASLTSQNLDAAGERERLAQLLRQLDAELQASRALHRAA